MNQSGEADGQNDGSDSGSLASTRWPFKQIWRMPTESWSGPTIALAGGSDEAENTYAASSGWICSRLDQRTGRTS